MLVTKTFAVAQCLSSAMLEGSRLLLNPGDAIKPYNRDIQVFPVAVAYPRTEKEVSSIVKCAYEAGLHVQARSGGHGYANYAYGGGEKETITIDLIEMKDFRLDSTNWQATVGPGYQVGEMSTLMEQQGGRAVAHGTCPSVGIGGHATIGGLGPASRMWGSLLDHVVEVRAVIANGTVITANDKENSDIFWAIKGAGSSFAIVTSFKLRTQESPKKMINYKFAFDFRDWKDIANTFKSWQKFVSQPNLSRKFASIVVMNPLGVIIQGTFFGSEKEFEAMGLNDVFPKRGSPNANVTVMESWLGSISQWGEELVLQSIGGATASFYSNSVAIAKDELLPDKAIDSLFEHFKEPKGTPLWFTVADLGGGAINDVPKNATAFQHRDILYYIQSYVVGMGGVSKATMKFMEEIPRIVSDGLGGKVLGAYPGYIDPKLNNPQEAYYGSNLPQLQRLKKHWDPQNVFKNPQSIKPIG